jgi:hypothetical protein
MDLIAGIADRLDDELRHNPFGLLSKQQYAGKVQLPLLGGKIHVLE